MAHMRGFARRTGLGVLCVLIASCAFGVGVASAAPMGVSGYFPAVGGLDLGGMLSGPQGVAVNSSGAGAADPGDVYVVDGGHRRVQVFSAAGEFRFAFGRDVIKTGGAGNVAVNERQRVVLAGASGGMFLLSTVVGSGVPTPLIPFDSPAQDPGTPGVVDSVQEALEATPSVGVGDVSVSGPAGGPWEVEFVGALADQNLQQMVVDSAGLTPLGASGSVTTLQEGVFAAERCTVAADCKQGFSGALGGMFGALVQGVAVDQSDGSVYVSDRGNLRVQKFSADGTFLRAWGKDVSTGNPSTGPEVCTTASDCKVGVTGGATLARGGEFTSTFSGYLTVVPAGAPNAGNVVVADPGNRRVQEFTPAGAFVRAWGYDVVQPGVVTGFEVCTVSSECKTAAASGAGVGQFATGQPLRVAADSMGAVYAVETTGNFRVQKFDQALTTPTVFAAGTLSGTASTDAPVDVAIGPGNDVLVAKQFATGTGVPPVQAAGGERRVLELDSTGVLQDVHAALAGLGADGLTADAAGKVYVTSRTFPPNFPPDRVYVLDAVTPPSGVVGVSAVGSHSALFSGAVDPNGPDTPIGVKTGYRLETSEDGVSWSAVVNTNAGDGFDAVGFSKTTTGLKPGTTYQSRLVIDKEFMPQVVIPGPTFTTPPSRPDVQALSPADRQTDSATLRGKIDPNGLETTYRFEYGPTAAYGTSAPAVDASVGDGYGAVTVSEPITGLEPGTTYHYRLIASNATGTAVTSDMTFTTLDGSPPPERGVEMVSQPDKIGGVGVGLWPLGIGHLASAGVGAYTGDRFMVGGSYGSPLNGDSKHGFTNDWSAADRTPAGWVSHPLITHPNYQPQIGQFVELQAVSQDLSRSYMTGGNNTPTIFPEMGTDNRWKGFNTGYFLDWGTAGQPSRWELLGPASLDQLSSSVDSSVSNVSNTAFSADGSRLVAQTTLDTASPARAAMFGLAGPGDPTWPGFGDLVAGRSVYLADTSGVPADTFAGTGTRTLVNTCTDAGGRTGLPAVSGGVLEEAMCLGPLPDRHSRLVSAYGAALAAPSNHSSLGGTVSADGSRVFFMSPDPRAAGVPTTGCTGSGDDLVCPTQLFVREERGGLVRTRWISKAEPGLFGSQAESLTGSVRFEGATPDGDKVFFRTTSPLTVDDPNGLGAAPPVGGVKTGVPSPQSSDLYMYDLPDDPNADLDTGELTRISAGPDGGDCNSPLTADDSADGPNSQAAALRFVSDDASRVYFACQAPLDGAAGIAGGGITNPAGSTTTVDQTNLYLYDTSQPTSRRWTFVARIPRGVGSLFETCASTGAIGRSPIAADSGAAGPHFAATAATQNANCFNGTGDGGFVTFFTTGRLTGDDPVSPVTGDVYAFDADAGELVRVTAAQAGAVGGSYLCAPGKPGSPSSIDTVLCHGDGGADNQSAVNTVLGGVVNSALKVVTDPEVPGDRVAFFHSAARLVPEDLDSGYDVYQWRNGVLSLITSGAADSKDALYRGNTRDGRNVFFATRDALTWQDYDAVNDVYVARVGGGIDQPDPPPPCDVLAGACQAGNGSGGLGVAPVSSGPVSDGDATVERARLSVAAVGVKARRQAVRSGVLVLRVRSSKAGRVAAVATGRVGDRTRRVGRASKTLAGPGSATLRIRLSRAARAQLRAGRRLGLSVRVSAPEARSRSLSVVLRRAGK